MVNMVSVEKDRAHRGALTFRALGIGNPVESRASKGSFRGAFEGRWVFHAEFAVRGAEFGNNAARSGEIVALTPAG
jgi:hypothetical protein